MEAGRRWLPFLLTAAHYELNKKDYTGCKRNY